MAQDSKTKRNLSQTLRHCWSGVSLYKGKKRGPKWNACVRSPTSPSSREQLRCGLVLMQVYRTRLADTENFLERPSQCALLDLFPKKKPVMLCRNGKKRLLSQHSLIAMKKITANSKIIKTRCFSFYCSLNSLYWGGEGKDPESLEDCGGELMLLRWTSNKTRVQKSARGRELPWQPKGSIKGQARKQMLEVMATCNKSVKPKTYWASFHHTGKSNR